MNEQRKRLFWIIVVIAMFFANLTAVGVFVFNEMTRAPAATATQSSTQAATQPENR